MYILTFSKKREVVPDLAPMLWNSFGTTAALLQEIINIYPAINPPTLTAHQSNRLVLFYRYYIIITYIIYSRNFYILGFAMLWLFFNVWHHIQRLGHNFYWHMYHYFYIHFYILHQKLGHLSI